MIRAFLLCSSLSVRDGVSTKTPEEHIFVQLPQHTLSITDLELTSSSGHRSLIDVLTLIKDVALDISSLTAFSCDATTVDVTRHTAMSVVASPIERLPLVYDETVNKTWAFSNDLNGTCKSSGSS